MYLSSPFDEMSVKRSMAELDRNLFRNEGVDKESTIGLLGTCVYAHRFPRLVHFLADFQAQQTIEIAPRTDIAASGEEDIVPETASPSFIC